MEDKLEAYEVLLNQDREEQQALVEDLEERLQKTAEIMVCARHTASRPHVHG